MSRSGEKMKEIQKTKSLCPECLKVIDATIYEKDGKVMMKKTCEEHGSFSDLVWSDAEYYAWAQKYAHDGSGVTTCATHEEKGCPYDCGLCEKHLTTTLLANIDLTNRCNLRCPICFANAAAAGYVLEPDRDEIKAILKRLATQKPVRCYGVQFSGGEPTVRDDLSDIIRDARELGFTQIQVATNGLKFSRDIDYAREVNKAGLNTVYLGFDGVTEKPYLVARGYNALPDKLKALENMRAAGYTSIVLVPVLVKGVSDDQVGDIVRFGMNNTDIIKGINFQPVSFSGRINKDELSSMRITIADLARLLEEQTDGQIGKEDLYPVPAVSCFSSFIEAWKQEAQITLTCHPTCGVGTYLFKVGDDILPITRFVDVDGLFSLLHDLQDTLGNGGKLNKAKVISHLTREAPKLIDNGKAPHGVNLRNLILGVLTNGTVGDTAAFHNKTLFLGAMHFMDPYNFDLDRVRRCGIHYGLPDGRIVPFCSYNAVHRPIFEKEYGIPLEEWKKQNRD